MTHHMRGRNSELGQPDELRRNERVGQGRGDMRGEAEKEEREMEGEGKVGEAKQGQGSGEEEERVNKTQLYDYFRLSLAIREVKLLRLGNKTTDRVQEEGGKE